MRTLAKFVKFNFFRALEINQQLNMRSIYSRKMAENDSNSEVCGALICSIHILFSTTLWWPLKPKSLAIKVAVKNSSLLAARGNRMALEFLKKSHPQIAFNVLTFLEAPLKSLIHRACCCFNWFSGKSPIPINAKPSVATVSHCSCLRL